MRIILPTATREALNRFDVVGPGSLPVKLPRGLPEPKEIAVNVGAVVRAQGEAYSHGEHRPLGGYLAILSGYVLSVGTACAWGRRRGVRIAERPPVADLALLSVATHRLARLVAKDSVTSPIRAPFTRFEEGGQPGEVNEEVRGNGARRAIGELLSCPFCVGQWAATGLIGGLILAPRATRWVASALVVDAAADALQFVRAMLYQAAEG